MDNRSVRFQEALSLIIDKGGPETIEKICIRGYSAYFWFIHDIKRSISVDVDEEPVLAEACVRELYEDVLEYVRMAAPMTILIESSGVDTTCDFLHAGETVRDVKLYPYEIIFAVVQRKRSISLMFNTMGEANATKMLFLYKIEQRELARLSKRRQEWVMEYFVP